MDTGLEVCSLNGLNFKFDIGMHLGFRLFDALFNHIDAIERIIRNNACPSKTLVIKACELASTKLAKYYSKTEGKGGLICNLAMVLASTQKLTLYRDWDTEDAEEEDVNKISHSYHDKYKKDVQGLFSSPLRRGNHDFKS